jgi:hypothetical protein
MSITARDSSGSLRRHHHAGYTDGVDHPLIVGPPVALGIFIVLMLMRDAAIAYEERGWGRLPMARMHWPALVVMAVLAAAVVMRMAGYW